MLSGKLNELIKDQRGLKATPQGPHHKNDEHNSERKSFVKNKFDKILSILSGK